MVTSISLFNPLHVSWAVDRFGRTNSAVFFNDGFIQMLSDVYFTGDHSVSMWTKIVSTGNQWQALYLIQNDVFVDYFGLFISPGGNFRVKFGQKLRPDIGFFLPIQQDAFINQWVHIGVTLGNNIFFFYFNGELVYSEALPNYFFVSNVIRESAFFGSPSYLLTAFIDDVFFYNRMLSETEMATGATYNSVNFVASNTPPQTAFAALQSNLAHYWTFNENYVNVVNGASGSPVGNVSFGLDHFGVANQALSISGGYVLLPTDVYLSEDFSIAFLIRITEFTPFLKTIIYLKRSYLLDNFYLSIYSEG